MDIHLERLTAQLPIVMLKLNQKVQQLKIWVLVGIVALDLEKEEIL